VLALVLSLAAPVGAQQGGWEPVVAAANPDALDLVVGNRPKPSARRPAAKASSPAIDAFMAPARTAEQRPQPAAAAAEPAVPARRSDDGPAQDSMARRYCVSIADAAADARYAWQKAKLAEIGEELEKRIALLEEKTAEFQKWVARRDEFVEKARQNLVLIYSRMRPDAAALQLTSMDEETASAVLLALDPRIASKILNDMEPAQAARLTAIIGGAAKGAPSRRTQAGPEGKKS
jgi:flagellar motility protein MotE (MotC chaperone)